MIRFSDIKICCLDVDGTLTDGTYQISDQRRTGYSNSAITKSFYTRDFYAIEQMMRSGIYVFIITQSRDLVIERQIDRLAQNSKFWMDSVCGSVSLKILKGIKNKKEAIHAEVLTRNEWGWHNVAYIGDAENDIECMKKALFTGCPSDAIDSVKENSNYISDFPGGKGAVYDFCMHIYNENDKENR